MHQSIYLSHNALQLICLSVCLSIYLSHNALQLCLSTYLSVCFFESISLSHTHTCTHTLTVCYSSGEIKLNLRPKHPRMFFIHTVAPLLLHTTQRQTKTCVSNTLTLLTRAWIHPQTNKRIHTSARFVKQPPPPKKTNSPHHRFTEVMLGQHLLSPIPPAPTIPSKISPSAPTSPSTTFCFRSTHTHTHTQGIWTFYCPICPRIQLSVHFKTYLLAIVPLHTLTVHTLWLPLYVTYQIVIPWDFFISHDIYSKSTVVITWYSNGVRWLIYNIVLECIKYKLTKVLVEVHCIYHVKWCMSKIL